MAILIATSLSACSKGLSGETVMGMVESPMWFKTASRATITAHFGEICSSYGYEKGTDAFRDCVRETETDRRASTMANFRASVDRAQDRAFGNSNSSNAELENLKSGLRTDCILSGGVWVGNRCL